MTRAPRNGPGVARADGVTVLLVDANASRRRALATALAEQGPQVRVAESGAQALGILHGESIDAIVLDNELPPRGAEPIVQRMKSDETLRDVAVIVLGDAGEHEERTQALDAGAEEFLPREVDVAELAVRLRNLTQLRAAFRELQRRNVTLSNLLKEESQRAVYFEQFSQSALEAVGGPVAVVDAQGVLVAVNQAFSALLKQRGLGPAEPKVGDAYPTLAVVGDALEAKRLSDSLLRVALGDCDQAVHEFQVTGEPPSWLSARLTRCFLAQSPHVMIAHEDVTQQHLTRGALEIASQRLQESQAQMMHAQKLDAIGRLVGGVSHDFNNHLTSIICFTRFVVDEMAQEDPRRADLVEVLRAADNAARLTNQLLTFSRRRPVQVTVLDLNAALVSLGRVMRRMLGERIELVILPSDDSAYALCDPGQFDQLIFSLALRAKDQMGLAGGAITLKLGHVQTGDAENIELLVSDTSSGLRPEQVAGAFDPYADAGGAANANDRSTGLDLAACAGIVAQAGGQISIASELGNGTTFRVLLPRVSEAKRAENKRMSMQPPPGLRGTALVVEDQPAILRSMSRALKAAGLSVLEANSGEDALAVLRTRATVPELLVTDMMLPGMSGVHLAEQLRSTTPELPVVYVSGYSSEDAQSVRVDAHTAFVAKPFTSRQLISRAALIMRGGAGR